MTKTNASCAALSAHPCELALVSQSCPSRVPVVSPHPTQSPPSPQMLAGGGSVLFMPPKPLPPPLLAPRASRRGFFFFSCCHLLSPCPCEHPCSASMPPVLACWVDTPACWVSPIHACRVNAPARCISAPGPARRANTLASARRVDAPGLCVMSIPLACAPRRCSRPACCISARCSRAPHQRPPPLRLRAALHRTCVCKCPLEGIISCSF